MKKIYTIKWLFLIVGVIDPFIMNAQTWIFNTVGSVQSFTVPQGVCRIKIIAKGAGGGGGTCGGCHFNGGVGGSGGYVEGIFTVNAGDVLNIYVGSGGIAGSSCYSGNCGSGPGGWGFTNGGNGGNGTPTPYPGRDAGGGGGGGGSSAVLINGSVAIVAGGGGGGGGGGSCGASGGAPGGDGGAGGGGNGGGQSGYEGIGGGASSGNGGNGMNGINYSSGAGGGGGGYPNGGSGGQVPPCGGTGGGGGGNSFCSGSPCVLNPGGGVSGGGQNVNGANGEVQIINISPPLNLSITSQSVSCYGYNDGCATAIPSGGNPPYSFSWSNTSTVQINCGLGPGVYTSTVIDVYGCKATNTVQIIEPTPVVPSVITKSVSCYDFSDGSATVTATGGTGTYNYYEFQPYGGAGSNNTSAFLHAGIYTVNVYDGNNCLGTQTFQIIQPSSITLAYTTQSVTCFNGTNGSATVTANGGISPYTFNWLPNVSSTNIISNVPYNTYTCQVVDVNGCTKEIHVPINQPQEVEFSFNTTPDRCHQNNGMIVSIVNGGVQPYQYLWSNGTTQYSVSGLAGNQVYTLTITDANNCVYSDTVFLPAPEPPLITATSFTPPLCNNGNDGKASISYTYGTPPMYYVWQPGGFNDTLIENVSAGTYTVKVIDYYGCMSFTTLTVTEPPPIGLNVSPDQVICYGTTATLNASAYNGTPPYQYFWDAASNLAGSGPHIVTLTTTTQYTVYAVDTNGCKSSDAVIAVTVKPPLLAKGENITICAEENYTLIPMITSPGNNGPYTYSWWNGASTNSIVITSDINNNPATYSVQISDGCSVPDAIAEFTINVLPKPNGYFTSDFQKGCPPLRVTFSAFSDGSQDQYYWNLGDGNQLAGNNIINDYLGVGTYTIGLQITNQYGCRRDTVIPDYIEVYPQPKADFEPMPSVTTIEDPLVNFSNLSTGNDFNLWNFGDEYSNNNTSTDLHPYHVYELAGEYDIYLTVKNTYGCMDVIMKRIKIDPVYHIYIPNVFTPDGNGLNDVFNIKAVGISEDGYLMLIYNRWGELIYQTNDLYKGWDGTIKNTSKTAKEDVYVYKIYTQDLKGNKYEYTGHVTCLPGETK